MSSTTVAPRPFEVRPSSEALVDVALVVALLAGSLTLLAHGGIDALRPGSSPDSVRLRSGDLDLVGVVLTVCSTVPLIAWRRFPLGVLAVTSTASVLLAGLDYPLDVMLGPAAALYLLAASREQHTSSTWRTTVIVVEAPARLASLNTLIAQHTAAGLEVTFGASGTARTLSDAADQAAYRILQEALTNAVRHGVGGARIEVAYGDAAVELTITNPVLADGPPRFGRGHGLIGMRERATLLGGDLDAQRANGTFWVRARIPYGGHRP